MKVEFSPHAWHRLAKREIPTDLIIKTISDPDTINPERDGRKVAQKKIRRHNKDKLCRVVFIEKGGEALVITAYITSKISKYK